MLSKRQKYSTKNIIIGNKKLKAIIADTATKRMIGLMYRKSMANSECMLFIFDNEGRTPIWMRSMQFAIDVIWLDVQKKVVGIETNLKPATGFDFRTYGPNKNSKYIIELNNGFVAKNKIKITSKINFSV
jgi:uncharacterized protein